MNTICSSLVDAKPVEVMATGFDREIVRATARAALARSQAATRGPWLKGRHGAVHGPAAVAAVFHKPEDAAFAASARDDLPLLAQAVLELLGDNGPAQTSRAGDKNNE